MKTIWKFPLVIKDEQTITIPGGAKILTVQLQKGDLYIWAIVDPNEPLRDRTIYVRGTGHPLNFSINKAIRYVGTFQLSAGDLVFHVFQKIMQ